MREHTQQHAPIPVDTGLDAARRQQMVDGLGRLLADTVTLQVKTQNFHWNVTGAQFGALHELFETQYRELFEASDELAERIRALGAPAPGGLAAYGELRRLVDADSADAGAEAMLLALRADHEAVVRDIRTLMSEAQAAADEGTADLLAGRLRAHEKHAWMLRASAEG